MEETKTFDLIVIGGGCNGTGIARDAAMRGLSTLLLEKNDFGNGTTGYSSHMIHGGARYLLYDPKTTKTSCLDAGYIRNIAPHIMYRIPMIVPFLKNHSKNVFKRFFMNHLYTYGAQAFFRGYNRYQVLKGGKTSTRIMPNEIKSIEPGLIDDISCAVTTDEWWIDTFRLCLLNALSAQEHGAVIKNGYCVEDLIQDESNQVTGVVARDVFSGNIERFYGDVVCNATGPWTPFVAKLLNLELKLRPGKGTHIVLDRRISNWSIATKAIDGRDIFTVPDHNCTLIGTTDDDFYGDLDSLYATQDEIEYLLEGIARVFPSVRKARPIRAVCGVRPTLYEWGTREEKLSRDHRVFDHGEEGAPGFISVAGGKLASYRLFAEEAVDYIAEKVGNKMPCKTHIMPLPGGEEELDPTVLAEEYALPELVIRRLLRRHGTRTIEILEQGSKQPDGFQKVCLCEPVLACELRYVMQHEFVRKASDLTRRCRAVMGPCQGVRCMQKVVDMFCDEKAVPEQHRQDVYQELRQELWQEIAPCVSFGGPTLKQSSLLSIMELQQGEKQK